MGLMWSLFFIRHLKLSGIWQILLLRTNTQKTRVTIILDYVLNICIDTILGSIMYTKIGKVDVIA